MTVLAGVELPTRPGGERAAEARGVPRDAVRMMVSRRRTGEITHHPFTDLPGLLLPGDLLVVNTSATLPAAVAAARVLSCTSPPRCRTVAGWPNCGPCAATPPSPSLAVRRARRCRCQAVRWRPWPGGSPGGCGRCGCPPRWCPTCCGTARTSTTPMWLPTGPRRRTRRSSAPRRAARKCRCRPFTAEMIARLVVRGVMIAPLTLHTGVSSLEGDEEPYPEP